MNAAWPDGCPNIVVEPADEVVLNIFWIEIHKIAGLGVLVINLNRVRKTNALEGLVPILKPLLYKAAIANGSGMFDVEANWRNRRA